MTSAEDFHLISLRNILGLCGVVVAVLIPVGLKRIFQKDLADLGEAEEVIENTDVLAREVDVPALDEAQPRRYQAVDSGVVLAGPSPGDPNLDTHSKSVKGKGRALHIIADIEEEDSDYEVFGTPSQTGRTGIKAEKGRQSQTIKGYGAIDPVPLEGGLDGSRTFWPFAR